MVYLSKQGDTIAVFDTKYEGDLPDISKNNTFKKWTSLKEGIMLQGMVFSTTGMNDCLNIMKQDFNIISI